VPRAGRGEGAVVLRLVCALACAALLLPATASAGTFQISRTPIAYAAQPHIAPIPPFDTGTSIRFTRFGGVSLGPGRGAP